MRWKMNSDLWNFSNDETPFFSHGIGGSHFNRTIIGSYAHVILCPFSCFPAIGAILIIEGWPEYAFSHPPKVSCCYGLGISYYFHWLTNRLQACGNPRQRTGDQRWVGDGTGQPWEIGGRNLEPQRLGMLSGKVSAEGSRVRPRQRWVGVSKKGDGVLRELGCWARYRDRLQPLESNSKNWVKMIPLLIRPAEKMEVPHTLCHKTEPGAQYFMFPYSGM